MKRLLLLRHAKAETGTGEDHARALAPRGVEDATAMAAAMKEAGYLPDFVVCSTATRTRQTCALAGSILGNPPVAYEDGLYLASWKSILKRIRETQDSSFVLMVVGHNTGLEECAAHLLRARADAAEQARRLSMRSKFPTGALAVIDCPIRHWHETAPEIGALTNFLRPRDL